MNDQDIYVLSIISQQLEETATDLEYFSKSHAHISPEAFAIVADLYKSIADVKALINKSLKNEERNG